MELFRSATMLDLKKADMLFRVGDPDEAMYVVERGGVVLHVQDSPEEGGKRHLLTTVRPAMMVSLTFAYGKNGFPVFFAFA
jgi:CRP-like cAMP-binding protein